MISKLMISLIVQKLFKVQVTKNPDKRNLKKSPLLENKLLKKKMKMMIENQ
jgi:hypothetical protein